MSSYNDEYHGVIPRLVKKMQEEQLLKQQYMKQQFLIYYNTDNTSPHQDIESVDILLVYDDINKLDPFKFVMAISKAENAIKSRDTWRGGMTLYIYKVEAIL